MPEGKKLYGKLENGMEYYIHNNNIKNKMRLILLNKTGSLNDGKNKNGIAHLIEHMCLSYNILNEEEETSNYLNSINTKKYIFSGYTDFDRTVLRIYRRFEESNLKNDLKILKSIFNGDVLRKEVLDKVKSEVIHECEYYKNKNIIKKKIMEFVTDGRVKDLPMGTPELIEKITIDDLIKFYDKNYTFDKGAIIVIGHVDVIEVEKMIIETFNNEKEITSTSSELKNSVMPYVKNEVLVLEDIENNCNVVHIYYRSMFENISMKKRLVRHFFSRMLENYIQTEFKLYNIDVSEVGCTDRKNMVENDYFIIIYKVDKLEETGIIYINIINKLVKNGFQERELKEQLDFLMNIIKEVINGESEISTEDLCEEYIKKFFDSEAMLLTKEDYDEVIKIISEIDINDINDLVKHILTGYCKIVEVRGKRYN